LREVRLNGRAHSIFYPVLLATALFAAHRAAAQGGPTTRAVTITIPNTAVRFEMIRVPEGELRMKDAAGVEKAHKVKPFWIGKTEVTWDEFDVLFWGLDLKKLPPEEFIRQNKARLDAYLGPSPRGIYSNPDRGWGHSGWPVGSLTLRASEGYCTWLSKKTGKKFRLPAEVEWEYAARAGGAPIALPSKELKDLAWFLSNSNEQTQKVAGKSANRWCLHDTLGNVAEWVVRDDKTGVVARGSFQDEATDVHTGARQAYSPDWQRDDPQDPKHRTWMSNGPHAGFRLVMED
jgi:formylglycine-generating enzyme required for sulfatase activity